MTLHVLPTKVVVFGSPQAGTPVMAASPIAALDLPLKLLIWSDDGQTKITSKAPTALAARYGLSEKLAARLAGRRPDRCCGWRVTRIPGSRRRVAAFVAERASELEPRRRSERTRGSCERPRRRDFRFAQGKAIVSLPSAGALGRRPLRSSARV